MILSHERRFVFIKTAKTAGTSVEAYLSRHCGPDDVVTPVDPPVEGHEPRNHRSFWNPLPEMADALRDGPRAVLAAPWRAARRLRFHNHIAARVARLRVPRRVREEYFWFCVERNPWDKTLSHYHMVRDRGGGTLDFDAYLASGSLCFNSPLYTDREGRVIVDRVIRYERLEAGLGEVFERLGIPWEGSLGVRAKSGHRTDRRPYREVYTPRQRRIVEEAFAAEIELHGYAFDG